MPPTQTRRIAAACTGRYTYVPGWLPAGFKYVSWQPYAQNILCDAGYAIRFRRGSTILTWTTATMQHVPGPPLSCGRAAHVVARVNGRPVYERTGGRVEVVWTCRRTYPWGQVVAVQPTGNGDASLSELERAVGSAHPLPPGLATRGRYELVPERHLRELTRAFHLPFYLPTRLPGGFIFADANVSGQNYLSVNFGRDGLILGWTISAGRAAIGFDCPFRAKERPDAQSSSVIGGTRVFLLVGIHGGSAWRCIAPHMIGNAKPLEVSLWYSITLDSPAFEREASEIVADARLVRRHR